MGFRDTLNGGQGGREVRRGSKTLSLDNEEGCGVLKRDFGGGPVGSKSPHPFPPPLAGQSHHPSASLHPLLFWVSQGWSEVAYMCL